MKTVLVSALLAVVFTSTLVNTEKVRERRQSAFECVQTVAVNHQTFLNAITQVGTSCIGTSCSSECMTALSTVKNNIGCCLNNLDINTDPVDIAYQLCSIAPPACDSASGILSSFFTISLFSILSYLLY